MKAIISDIHSNLEALQAVLDDIRQYDVEAIYCLGDMVGYGPNPRECLDLVMELQGRPAGQPRPGRHVRPRRASTAPAERAIFWTRDQLEGAADPAQPAANGAGSSSPNGRGRHKEDGFLFVHGSARNPLNEYVFPEDIYNQRKMERIFALVERYCFQGHTHVPGVFTESRLASSTAPDEIDYCYQLDGRKTLVNVGSVGQPRDGDSRACYVLLDDDDTVYFRRVEYDMEATIQKIYDDAGAGQLPRRTDSAKGAEKSFRSIGFLVPKLCLGTPVAKLRFA